MTFAGIGIIFSAFIYVYLESVGHLLRVRNPAVTISSIIHSVPSKHLQRFTDAQLGTVMLSSMSIFDQIRSRTLYCRRHPDGLAISYNWNHHPICLKDRGSSALSGLPFDGTLDIPTIDLSDYQFVSLPKSALVPYPQDLIQKDAKFIAH